MMLHFRGQLTDARSIIELSDKTARYFGKIFQTPFTSINHNENFLYKLIFVYLIIILIITFTYLLLNLRQSFSMNFNNLFSNKI